MPDVKAFSSEVDPGSREENASKQESRAPFRCNRNGKGSGHRSVISRKTRRRREMPAPRPWSAGPARDCGAGSGRTGG
ncbi:hypothetical protein BSN85_05680 [Bradyrhizobium brasilense]|nr:hypothetical protein BSN85_05680 [Bradyrhizobium brasilense]